MNSPFQRSKFRGGVFDDQLLLSPVDLEMASQRRRLLVILLVVAALITAACWYW
ncbi:MAG: hypothetical protein AAF657_25415 [Acidobacteriota bacterium]